MQSRHPPHVKQREFHIITLRHTSGYQEPLQAEARAEIDAKYSVDPSKYQFKGCLSDDKVTREAHAIHRNPRSRTLRHKIAPDWCPPFS